MQCPWKYGTNYIDNIAPMYPPMPMQRGSLGHRALELGLLAERIPDAHIAQKLSDEQEERCEELGIDPATVTLPDVDEMVSIARRAWLALGIGERYKTWTTPDGERAIELQIKDESMGRFGQMLGTKGKIDWIAVDTLTGDLMAPDFKFVDRFAAADENDYALQFAIYQLLVLHKYGVYIPKSGRYQIRSRKPAVPELLKKGDKLSTDKRITTDWRTYEAAIKRHGFDVEDYAEMQALLTSEDKMQRMDLTYRSVVELGNYEREVNLWAQVIADDHGMGDSHWMPRARTSRNCRGCTHQSLCEAGLRGEDVEFIREAYYTNRLDPKRLVIVQGVEMIDDMEAPYYGE